MKGYMEKISFHFGRGIRCIIWKQLNVPVKRIKSLIKLGVSPIIANKYSCSDNRYWQISMTVVIYKAISNKRSQQRGLICPIDHYNKIHIW